MQSRSILSSLGLAILVVLLCNLTACTPVSDKKKNFLIGIINPNKGTQAINRGFIDGLAEAGYIEGKNTTYIRAESTFELDQAIQDMIVRKVDLLFTVTTPATKKARDALQNMNIPIVFAMQDPVASDIIRSLAQHNDKITGVQIRGSVPKAVEWILAVMPDARHFFVPIKYDTKAALQSLEDLRAAAEHFGIKLSVVEVNDQPELDNALADIPTDVDVIFLLHSIFIHSNTPKLVQEAIEKKLLIGSAAAQSDIGVTVSYGIIPEKTGRQASRLANLILKGISPRDIPAEISDFYLGVNLLTATASGIGIPADVLQQADIIVR